MKRLLTTTALVLTALPALARTPVRAIDTTPVLRSLQVTKIEQDASVLGRNQVFPVETIVIGLTATVDPQNACTSLAGFEVSRLRNADRITVKGASDAVNPMCISVLPEPMTTVIPVTMHLNNHAMPSVDVTTALFEISGKWYRVRYDAVTDQAEVSEATPRWP